MGICPPRSESVSPEGLHRRAWSDQPVAPYRSPAQTGKTQELCPLRSPYQSAHRICAGAGWDAGCQRKVQNVNPLRTKMPVLTRKSA